MSILDDILGEDIFGDILGEKDIKDLPIDQQCLITIKKLKKQLEETT